MQLLKDIQAASKTEQGHFIGSIVYFQPNIHTIAEIHDYLVIDGQQRLTTITLLIAALVKFIEENPNTDIGTTAKKLKITISLMQKRNQTYTINYYSQEEIRKLWKCLLSNRPLPEKSSSRILENFDYFFKQISDKMPALFIKDCKS